MYPLLISRRGLLAAASAYAVLQASLPVRRAIAAEVRVRENIEQFSQDPPKVSALRAAVKRMKERSAANENDPLGWYYWSAIHWTNKEFPEDLKDIYNQCDHSSSMHLAIHFLSWHRAFLFFFEAVLKQTANEAGVTTPLELPYWDWYSTPKIASTFTEGNESSNPLWHERENTDISGWELRRTAFGFDDMVWGAGVPPTKTFSLGIEGNPHGTVHGAVGKDMGAVPTSARDPIFWLHHANIDRLWTAWMKNGTRTLPGANSVWGNKSWDFDVSGQWHQTAGAMLDSEQAPLSYRYDNESVPSEVTPTMMMAASTKTIEAQPLSVDIDKLKSLQAAQAVQPVAPAAISATSGTIQLGDEAVAVNLKLATPDAVQLNSFALAEPAADIKSARLVLQDVELSPEGKDGGFSYDVVASLPDGQGERVVLGTLNTFTLSAAVHGPDAEIGKQTFVFPLNEILPALGPTTPEDLAEGLKVTFEPSQPKDAREDLLRIGSVKIEVSTLPND